MGRCLSVALRLDSIQSEEVAGQKLCQKRLGLGFLRPVHFSRHFLHLCQQCGSFRLAARDIRSRNVTGFWHCLPAGPRFAGLKVEAMLCLRILIQTPENNRAHVNYTGLQD